MNPWEKLAEWEDLEKPTPREEHKDGTMLPWGFSLAYKQPSKRDLAYMTHGFGPSFPLTQPLATMTP